MSCRICATRFLSFLSLFFLIGAAPNASTTRPAARADQQRQQQRDTRERSARVEPRIQVYFSPNGGCTEAAVEQINAAKVSLDIQAYSFTSAPIAKAVVDAHNRGVKVRAVLDKSQRTAKYTSATFLANGNVPTFIDSKHAIAHNKIMLIDGATIITGSFNFTKAAEQSNAENMLIITGHPELVTEYQKNFTDHLAHSQPYERADASGDAGK